MVLSGRGRAAVVLIAMLIGVAATANLGAWQLRRAAQKFALQEALASRAQLPEIGTAAKPPHRPLHNAGLYWHFVDLVWIVIVGLLYVAPNVSR